MLFLRLILEFTVFILVFLKPEVWDGGVSDILQLKNTPVHVPRCLNVGLYEVLTPGRCVTCSR